MKSWGCVGARDISYHQSIIISWHLLVNNIGFDWWWKYFASMTWKFLRSMISVNLWSHEQLSGFSWRVKISYLNMTNQKAWRRKHFPLDLTLTLPDAKQTTNDVNNLYSQDRSQENYFRSEMTRDLFPSFSQQRLLIFCNAIIWLLHIFLCDS